MATSLGYQGMHRKYDGLEALIKQIRKKATVKIEAAKLIYDKFTDKYRMQLSLSKLLRIYKIRLKFELLA